MQVEKIESLDGIYGMEWNFEAIEIYKTIFLA